MKYKVTERQLLIDEYFKVEEVKVTFDRFKGDKSSPARRFNLIRGKAVSALLYHKEKKAVLLVKQFRYSTAESGFPWLMELPAGLTDENETPLTAVKRELVEETGYQPSSLQEIFRFFVAPGCTDEEIILYYGEISEKDKIAAGGGLDGEHEDIQLFWLPVDNIKEYITENIIHDAKSIIALYWLLNNKDVNRHED